MQKKQYLRIHWQNNSTASLKNSTGVSAHFSNYVDTVYTVDTVDMVYTVDTVYTVILFTLLKL